MASAPMQVEIVSPERVLFSGESTQVITRTAGGGEIAFLPGHAPFLGALVESHTRIYLTDGTILNVAVHRGFVQVGHNKVSILSDVAELEEQIDRQRAAAAKERAEEQLRHDAQDAEAQAALARAMARLNATGGIRTGAH
jgi:F-type H+-transporting ATPase subunit epsilon